MQTLTRGQKAKAHQIPASLKHVASLCVMELAEYEPAVYFLIRSNEVVYVGQSKRPRERISAHVGAGEKVFDRVLLRHCAEAELDAVESMFIHLLEPEYNCTLPNGTKLSPLAADELEKFGMHRARAAGKTDPPPQSPAASAAITYQHAPQIERLIRLPEVLSLTGESRTQLYEGIKTGTHPAPLKDGRASSWVLSEVRAYVDSKVARLARQRTQTRMAVPA